jgi:hypothetical protein
VCWPQLSFRLVPCRSTTATTSMAERSPFGIAIAWGIDFERSCRLPIAPRPTIHHKRDDDKIFVRPKLSGVARRQPPRRHGMCAGIGEDRGARPPVGQFWKCLLQSEGAPEGVDNPTV